MNAAALLLLAGCAGAHWTEQRAPQGPCFAVDLADGLAATTTTELHALYACLDGGGVLASFAGVDEALDGATAGGTVGDDLVRVLAGVIDHLDGNLADAVSSARGVLQTPDALGDGARAVVEIVYGRAMDAIDPDTMASPDALERGMVVPMLPVLGATAAGLVGDDAVPALAARVLASPRLAGAAWTARAALDSTSPRVTTLRESLGEDLAAFVTATREAGNDRWPGASGDSLRDLASAALAPDAFGRPALDVLGGPLTELLDAHGVRGELAARLGDHARDGTLAGMPGGLLHLVTVDAGGDAARGDDDSALVALLRLLDRANQPFHCSASIGPFNPSVHLDNLAVTALGLLAEMDPDNARPGVSLAGDLLGVGISASLLRTLADSGACPVLDRQMVDDLAAIDRLSDPEAQELLRVLLDALAAARPALAALADTGSAAYRTGLVPPLEELLRDAVPSGLVTHALDAAPVLADPHDHLDTRAFPAGVDPVDLALVLDVLRDAVSAGPDGRTPAATLAPMLRTVLGADATWDAVATLSLLAGDPDAHLGEAARALVRSVETDPTLDGARQMADVLSDPAVTDPALRLAGSSELRRAIAATDADAPGPLPFLGMLVVGGTLDAVLDTLSLLSTLIPEDPDDAR